MRNVIKHGCYNHKPFKTTLDVQDGWNENGTRKMITIPVKFTTDCQYDLKLTDGQCDGCCWQYGENHGRDV